MYFLIFQSKNFSITIPFLTEILLQRSISFIDIKRFKDNEKKRRKKMKILSFFKMKFDAKRFYKNYLISENLCTRFRLRDSIGTAV